MVRGRPGPAPQAAKREWFSRLIARGVSNAEACRIVGVNPRTGKRWGHGRTITVSGGRRLHYPPVINTGKTDPASAVGGHMRAPNLGVDLRERVLGW